MKVRYLELFLRKFPVLPIFHWKSAILSELSYDYDVTVTSYLGYLFWYVWKEETPCYTMVQIRCIWGFIFKFTGNWWDALKRLGKIRVKLKNIPCDGAKSTLSDTKSTYVNKLYHSNTHYYVLLFKSKANLGDSWNHRTLEIGKVLLKGILKVYFGRGFIPIFQYARICVSWIIAFYHFRQVKFWEIVLTVGISC